MPGCSRAACAAEGDSVRCTLCRVAGYCSRACQKQDRKAHKRVCATLANAAPAPAAAAAGAAAPAPAAEEEDVPGRIGPKLAPFNPTNDAAIDMAVDMLQLGASDVVYELGCGDARFLIAAARASGCSGVGVEYDEALAARAQAAVEEAGLAERLRIVHGDATAQDLAPATALFVYLVPDGIRQVRGVLDEALARGARIATNIFSLPWLEPVEVRTYKVTKVYLYTSGSGGGGAGSDGGGAGSDGGGAGVSGSEGEGGGAAAAGASS